MKSEVKTAAYVIAILAFIIFGYSSGAPKEKASETYFDASSMAKSHSPIQEKEKPEERCHSSYSGCLNPSASDYDCANGSGNGPYYTGTVRVIGPDVFGLDRDGNGWGCE